MPKGVVSDALQGLRQRNASQPREIVVKGSVCDTGHGNVAEAAGNIDCRNTIIAADDLAGRHIKVDIAALAQMRHQLRSRLHFLRRMGYQPRTVLLMIRRRPALGALQIVKADRIRMIKHLFPNQRRSVAVEIDGTEPAAIPERTVLKLRHIGGKAYLLEHAAPVKCIHRNF